MRKGQNTNEGFCLCNLQTRAKLLYRLESCKLFKTRVQFGVNEKMDRNRIFELFAQGQEYQLGITALLWHFYPFRETSITMLIHPLMSPFLFSFLAYTVERMGYQPAVDNVRRRIVRSLLFVAPVKLVLELADEIGVFSLATEYFM
jgi:hypothetical protein